MLQQVWVVDAAGNLQPTTVLVPLGHDGQLQLGGGGGGGGGGAATVHGAVVHGAPLGGGGGGGGAAERHSHQPR